MPTKGEWAVIGLIIAAFAGIGIALYLTRKPTQGLTLKRINQPQVILRNLERTELIRDENGDLKELVIHREVTE